MMSKYNLVDGIPEGFLSGELSFDSAKIFLKSLDLDLGPLENEGAERLLGVLKAHYYKWTGQGDSPLANGKSEILASEANSSIRRVAKEGGKDGKRNWELIFKEDSAADQNPDNSAQIIQNKETKELKKLQGNTPVPEGWTPLPEASKDDFAAVQEEYQELPARDKTPARKLVSFVKNKDCLNFIEGGDAKLDKEAILEIVSKFDGITVLENKSGLKFTSPKLAEQFKAAAEKLNESGMLSVMHALSANFEPLVNKLKSGKGKDEAASAFLDSFGEAGKEEFFKILEPLEFEVNNSVRKKVLITFGLDLEVGSKFSFKELIESKSALALGSENDQIAKQNFLIELINRGKTKGLVAKVAEAINENNTGKKKKVTYQRLEEQLETYSNILNAAFSSEAREKGSLEARYAEKNPKLFAAAEKIRLALAKGKQEQSISFNEALKELAGYKNSTVDDKELAFVASLEKLKSVINKLDLSKLDEPITAEIISGVNDSFGNEHVVSRQGVLSPEEKETKQERTAKKAARDVLFTVAYAKKNKELSSFLSEVSELGSGGTGIPEISEMTGIGGLEVLSTLAQGWRGMTDILVSQDPERFKELPSDSKEVKQLCQLFLESKEGEKGRIQTALAIEVLRMKKGEEGSGLRTANVMANFARAEGKQVRIQTEAEVSEQLTALGLKDESAKGLTVAEKIGVQLQALKASTKIDNSKESTNLEVEVGENPTGREGSEFIAKIEESINSSISELAKSVTSDKDTATALAQFVERNVGKKLESARIALRPNGGAVYAGLGSVFEALGVFSVLSQYKEISEVNQGYSTSLLEKEMGLTPDSLGTGQVLSFTSNGAKRFIFLTDDNNGYGDIIEFSKNEAGEKSFQAHEVKTTLGDTHTPHLNQTERVEKILKALSGEPLVVKDTLTHLFDYSGSSGTESGVSCVMRNNLNVASDPIFSEHGPAANSSQNGQKIVKTKDSTRGYVEKKALAEENNV